MVVFSLPRLEPDPRIAGLALDQRVFHWILSLLDTHFPEISLEHLFDWLGED
jgi:hypothetical protein